MSSLCFIMFMIRKQRNHNTFLTAVISPVLVPLTSKKDRLDLNEALSAT